MRKNSLLTLITGMLLLTSSSLSAQESSSELDIMRQRLAEMEARLAEVSREGGAAERVSKTSTATTLNEKGALFASNGDGKSFKLRMSTLFQSNYILNDVHGQGTNHNSDTSNVSLGIARTTFSGHVVHPAYRYKLQIDWLKVGDSAPSSNGLALNQGFLNDAYVGYNPSDAWGFYMGQRRTAYDSIFSVEEDKRQFATQSLATNRNHQGYTKGFWFTGTPTLGEGGSAMQLYYDLGLFNGEVRPGADFRNNDNGAFAFDRGLDMMFAGRIALLLFGGADYLLEHANDLRSSAEQKETLIMIGHGFNYIQDDSQNRNGASPASISPNQEFDSNTLTNGFGTVSGAGDIRIGSADIWNLTWDVRALFLGFSLNAGFFYQSANFKDKGGAIAGRPAQITNLSWFAQGSYVRHFPNGHISEIGIRFSQSDLDEFDTGGGSPNDSTGPDADQLSLTASYYLAGRSLKATLGYNFTKLDWPQAAQGVAGPVDNLASDLHQVVFQVQLKF